jgi:GLPGLI family protein
MMRNLLVLSLMLVPVTASAQQGSILFDLAVQFDYSLLPEGREALRDQIPPQTFTSMVLLFDGSESFMKSAPRTEDEAPSELNARLQGFVTRLKMGSASRSDHETLVEAYVNYEDGSVADLREFMGRDFLITGEQPTYAWRLTGEQSEFLGFTVQRATAVQDSTNIEAWFTTEIPTSGGPGGYGGLPGMILAASIGDGQSVYSATEVDLDVVLEEGAIRPPEAGNEVSRDEYEEIVEEKLEELRMLNGQEARNNAGQDVRRRTDDARRPVSDRPPGGAGRK